MVFFGLVCVFNSVTLKQKMTDKKREDILDSSSKYILYYLIFINYL